MKIKFLGHASFVITASDNTAILTDPYQPGAFGGAIGYDSITDRVDVATISHEHEDHAGISGLTSRPLIVRGECRAKGITFDALSTYHDDQEGQARGENRIFAFEVDEIRVCHFGDLGHTLTPEQVEALGKVNVALIPVGGEFTVGPSEAWEIITQLNPNIVIPMHFKTPKVGFPLATIDRFLEGKSNVRREIGSEIHLSAESLPEPIQIVFLPPAN